jgi:hypothetical protein
VDVIEPNPTFVREFSDYTHFISFGGCYLYWGEMVREVTLCKNVWKRGKMEFKTILVNSHDAQDGVDVFTDGARNKFILVFFWSRKGPASK